MFPSDSGLPDRLSSLFSAIAWRIVLRDLAVVFAWVLAVSFAFRALGLPTWLYYVVVFGGVVGYSLVTGPLTVRTES